MSQRPISSEFDICRGLVPIVSCRQVGILDTGLNCYQKHYRLIWDFKTGKMVYPDQSV